MTRLALLLATATLLAAAPAASAQAPLGGVTSDNVEYVKNFASHADSSGARLKDGYFYITTERDLSIYDVEDAENPVRVGHMYLDSPGRPVFTEEDPDTNGRILLIWNGDELQVVDVSDKTAPEVIGRVAGPDQHTVSCILDCTWAYGSEGAIVDLRDPKAPRLVEGDWNDQVSPDSTHDVTEVSPGIVMTSTEPIFVLDAREDPTQPKVLAKTDPPGFTHANLWPNGGTDRFALVGGEAAASPDCSDDTSATFQTFDTTGWQGRGGFQLVDQFSMSTGTVSDGRSPYTTWCVHWFTEHPTFHGGGLVAIAWYEHGVRFLKVGTDGKIEEIGHYLPYIGQSSAVYWITDRVLYTADYYRGMDVLKFTGDIPQGTPRTPGGGGGPATPPGGDPGGKPRGLPFNRYVKLPSARRCVRSLRVRPRSTEDPVTRLVVRINGRRRAIASGSRVRRGVTLRKLPRKKRFRVQVQVRTRSGHTTAGQRTYRGC